MEPLGETPSTDSHGIRANDAAQFNALAGVSFSLHSIDHRNELEVGRDRGCCLMSICEIIRRF
jgi:hypothetical protein